MKYSNSFIVLIPLLMMSCLEIDTLTKIHPDGTLERSVEVKGSEAEISKTSFNLPRKDRLDWQISQEPAEDENVLYRAKRKFESVQALNESFSENSGPLRMKIRSELDQTEGLFFTRTYYSEKVWADLPGPNLPITEYVSQSEFDAFILSGTDAGEGLLDSIEARRIEDRLDLYLQKTIFEDFAGELRRGARLSDSSDEVEALISEHADSLVVQLNSTNYYDENQAWKSILKTYLPNELLDLIQESNAEGFDQFYTRWQFFEELILNDYSFSIELPGVIRKTTALDVRGNRMTWEPEAISFFFGGVVMEAESSQVRIWSVVLTAALFLLTLVVTIVSFVRQRKNSSLI